MIAKLVRQFIKFGLVGISNTLLFFLIYYALLFVGIHYLLANTIAFFVSVLNAYYWNSKFVFKQTKERYSTLARVYISYGFTFALSSGLLFFMIDILGISEYIAPILNLCITIPLNFLLNKYWAFKDKE